MVNSPVLYMPVNRPVVFKIRSLDVIHSFFVPDFSEKIDAVPGITTTLRVTATRTGSYPAECTELCGAGHALMRAAVRVVSTPQFNTWMAAQKPNAPPPLGAPPPNGAGPGIPGSPKGASGNSGSAASVTSPRTVAWIGADPLRRAS